MIHFFLFLSFFAVTQALSLVTLLYRKKLMFRVEAAEDAGASSALETGSHMTPQTLATNTPLPPRKAASSKLEANSNFKIF